MDCNSGHGEFTMRHHSINRFVGQSLRFLQSCQTTIFSEQKVGLDTVHRQAFEELAKLH